MTSSQWNNKLVKCVSLPTWSCVELAQLDTSSQMRLPKPLSHLWYGHILTNSLLSGILQQLIRKLKKVQNCSARLIFKTSKCTHASPLLTKLHWLPIGQRIEYEVSSMCCAVVSGTAQPYLSDLLQLYMPSRSLQSLLTPAFLDFKLKEKVSRVMHFCPSGPCQVE